VASGTASPLRGSQVATSAMNASDRAVAGGGAWPASTMLSRERCEDPKGTVMVNVLPSPERLAASMLPP
jgi:hypothetical protein